MARFIFSPLEAPEGILASDWDNWSWQLRQGLKSKEDFEKYFILSPLEEVVFSHQKSLFNIRTTPYYAHLARQPGHEALRKIMIPHAHELSTYKQAMLDPLAEIRNRKKSRVIHRYSDRVLLLVTDFCSVYCRYCTRKHFTGQERAMLSNQELQEAIDYLKVQKGVREVILSGGDPLTLSDQQLDRILGELRKVEHLEIIRIGSRMPVVAPQRITTELVSVLRKHKPIFMMTHFNHPKELTAQSAQACELFVDHGVPVFNQMVLLNGVNNHASIVQALSRRLLRLRVKPYYMFQCDPSLGSDHLRTSIDESLEIQKELWGHLSGLAMPQYAVDIPEGGGKTVLTPNFQISANRERRTYIGWDGVKADYINPEAQLKELPPDLADYTPEWQQVTGGQKIKTLDSEKNHEASL